MDQVEFHDVPLTEVVAVIEQFTTLKIAFDTKTLGSVGVSPNDPVTVELKNATAEEILTKALSARGLIYTVQNGKLLITCGR